MEKIFNNVKCKKKSELCFELIKIIERQQITVTLIATYQTKNNNKQVFYIFIQALKASLTCMFINSKFKHLEYVGHLFIAYFFICLGIAK